MARALPAGQGRAGCGGDSGSDNGDDGWQAGSLMGKKAGGPAAPHSPASHRQACQQPALPGMRPAGTNRAAPRIACGATAAKSSSTAAPKDTPTWKGGWLPDAEVTPLFTRPSPCRTSRHHWPCSWVAASNSAGSLRLPAAARQELRSGQGRAGWGRVGQAGRKEGQECMQGRTVEGQVRAVGSKVGHEGVDEAQHEGSRGSHAMPQH